MPNNPPKNDTPDKALVERLRQLAYNHTAPGDGVGRNTYGDAVREIARLAALSQTQHGGLVEAARVVDAVVGSNADGCVSASAAYQKCCQAARAALASNSPVVGEDAAQPERAQWESCGCPTPPYDDEVVYDRNLSPRCPRCNVALGGDPMTPSERAEREAEEQPTPTDTADRREAIARVLYAVEPIRITSRKEPLTFEEVAADGCWVEPGRSFKRADALIAASLIAVPDGMCIVPREPTEAMIDAGSTCAPEDGCYPVWSAMIAAATGEA